MRTEKRIAWWSRPQNSAHTPAFGYDAGPIGDVDLERRVLVGEGVALEAEARDPERVDDVGWT